MLTIVTGVPEDGKTLHTLQRLLDEFKPAKGEEKRPIFVNGVPDLNYEHFDADELVDPEKWYELPVGSVIFIDEAQRVFPQRPPSIPVPEKCQQMSVHRHKGYDMFITTQDATNIDTFVRKMCGRHIHVHRILNREVATIYEFDHWQSNPTGWAEKKTAISVKPWKYPKNLYKKYKSATMHTYKARTPLKLYLIPIAAAASLWLFYWAFEHIKERGGLGDETVQEELISNAPPELPPRSDGSLNFLPRDYQAIHTAVIPGIEHTKPFYQGNYKAESYPVPHCVIYNDGWGCKCYTEQITTYPTTDELCRYWAIEGFYDPTKEELYAGAKRGGQAQAPAAAY